MITNARNRIATIEDQLRVDECPTCQNLGQLRVVIAGSPEDTPIEPCPACGKVAAGIQKIVIDLRPDGPQ